MEGLTRLVTESLVRHGFDRPLDYRRLQWSRWFRCDSHHSLLFVPSKAGVFAVAEEITHLATGVSSAPPTQSAAELLRDRTSDSNAAQPASSPETRRMLAVSQFFEADDMAFVLDRMLSRPNPMREHFESGRYFVRFVVIEDGSQRRSIATALNQWIATEAEKATGIGPHFASSLELTAATEYVPPSTAQASLFDNVHVPRAVMPAASDTATQSAQAEIRPNPHATAPHLDSGAATNIHCPSPFPSGF